MPRLPGVQHMRAVRALEKAGFVVVRQSKHIMMEKGRLTVMVPRNNPVNANTMGRIVRDAGMTIEEFRRLL
jgi:predicted RNA binding protein YcfA (HicA-like mRNA interferase family)